MVRYQIQEYMKERHQFWCPLLVVKNILFEILYLLDNVVEKFNFVYFVTFAQDLILLGNKLVVESMLD